MGPPVTLTFKGSKTLQTNFGLLMTFMCFASILAASIVFLKSFFDRSLPTVTDDVLAGVKVIKHHIGNEGILPLIFVKRRSDNSLVSADIVHKYFRGVLTYNLTSNRTGRQMAYVYESTPCRNLHDKNEKLNYLKMAENYDEINELTDFAGYCLDVDKNNEIYVKEDLNPLDPDVMKNDRRLVVMSIQPCHVVAENVEAECGLIEDLNSFIIDVHFPVHITNFSRPHHPVTRRYDLKNKVMLPDLNIIRFEYYFTKRHEIRDLFPVFDKTTYVDSYIELTTASPTYQFRMLNATGDPQYTCSDITCKYIYYMRFEPKFEDVVHTRRYKQLSVVLSEIGGISSLLFQVFTYLNLIYLGFARKQILVARLFPSIPLQKNENCFVRLFKKLCCCCCCPKKNYSDEQEMSAEAKKFWQTMMGDGVRMIDASIDLAVIFKELCTIRVLSDILMDDVQRDLVTLSSLQVFRKQNTVIQKLKDRIKTIEAHKGNKSEDMKLQQERKQQRESLEALANRCQKKGRNKNQLFHKIDNQILKSLQELNIDAVRAGHRTQKTDDVQDIVKLISQGQAFEQAKNCFLEVKPNEKFSLAKILTKNLVFFEEDPNTGQEEGSPLKLELGQGIISMHENFEVQGPLEGLPALEVNKIENEDVSQEPAVHIPHKNITLQ
jgi:hypothetical protein